MVAGKPGEADDRIEHDIGVGMRGELRQRAGLADARAREIAGNAERPRLLGEQLGVAARRERDDAVLVGVAGDDVEGLRTDRARRPQDHDTATHGSSLRAGPGGSVVGRHTLRAPLVLAFVFRRS